MPPRGFTAAAPGGVVFADAAGPTDYRSEIVDVSPEVPEVELSIEGGDAFVLASVEPGNEVLVLGYAREPYLLIDTEGVVFENRRSAATYYNESRYGGDIPDDVDPDAEPDWVQVGDGGAWAWHDHRAHWMSSEPPIGAEPGDTIQEFAIPIRVNGDDVSVLVTTTWLSPVSKTPALVGLAAGLAAVGAALFARRSWRTIPMVLGSLALAATFVGSAQVLSLHPSTDPRWTWWALPLTAAIAAVVSLAVRDQLLSAALVGVASFELVTWAWQRRTGLTRVILPTDLPFWVDRIVSGAALTAGLAGAIYAVVSLMRRPVPVSTPG